MSTSVEIEEDNKVYAQRKNVIVPEAPEQANIVAYRLGKVGKNVKKMFRPRPGDSDQAIDDDDEIGNKRSKFRKINDEDIEDLITLRLKTNDVSTASGGKDGDDGEKRDKRTGQKNEVWRGEIIEREFICKLTGIDDTPLATPEEIAELVVQGKTLEQQRHFIDLIIESITRATLIGTSFDQPDTVLSRLDALSRISGSQAYITEIFKALIVRSTVVVEADTAPDVTEESMEPPLDALSDELPITNNEGVARMVSVDVTDEITDAQIDTKVLLKNPKVLGYLRKIIFQKRVPGSKIVQTLRPYEKTLTDLISDLVFGFDASVGGSHILNFFIGAYIITDIVSPALNDGLLTEKDLSGIVTMYLYSFAQKIADDHWPAGNPLEDAPFIAAFISTGLVKKYGRSFPGYRMFAKTPRATFQFDTNNTIIELVKEGIEENKTCSYRFGYYMTIIDPVGMKPALADIYKKNRELFTMFKDACFTLTKEYKDSGSMRFQVPLDQRNVFERYFNVSVHDLGPVVEVLTQIEEDGENDHGPFGLSKYAGNALPYILASDPRNRNLHKMFLE